MNSGASLDRVSRFGGLIPDLPTGWSYVPLMRLLARNDGGAWGDDPTGDGDTIVLRSTEQTVDGRWNISEPALRQLSEREAQGTRLEAGDLLVTKSSGSSLHIGKTTLVDADLAALRPGYSNFMQRLRTTSALLPKFCWYFLNSEVARTQVDVTSTSSTGLANLTAGLLGRLLAPMAPVNDQAALVDSLDRETATIDALIAEQEHLVELLQEKRQAAISHAVTKGLDPNVPMKESGVDWLGDVPAHWESTRYKNVLKEKPFVPGAQLPAGAISFGRVVFKDDEAMNVATKATYQEVLRGEFLINPINLNYDLKSLRTALSSIDTCVSPAYLVLQPKRELDLSYFKHQLFVFDIRHMKTLGAGVRQTIGFGDIGPCRIQLPPLSEQRAISSFLNRVTAKIDALITEAESVILLLQERRSAFITAAVTGQIDVRGLVDTAA